MARCIVIRSGSLTQPGRSLLPRDYVYDEYFDNEVARCRKRLSDARNAVARALRAARKNRKTYEDLKRRGVIIELGGSGT